MTSSKSITLAQGLKEFYETYDTDLSHTDEAIPEDVQAFFRSHDIAHVLFGCDISLYGEGSVKIWTILGTSLGFWRHLREYRRADAFELSKKLDRSKSFKDLIRLIRAIPILILRARRMHRPWPWSGFEQYLDSPIHEIRKEFNIDLL